MSQSLNRTEKSVALSTELLKLGKWIRMQWFVSIYWMSSFQRRRLYATSKSARMFTRSLPRDYRSSHTLAFNCDLFLSSIAENTLHCFSIIILRAVGRELMEELWKGGWRRAMTLRLDRSRICVGILIIIEMNLSRSSYFFILVPDGARPPSDQIVSLILLGTGANSPQTFKYFLSYLLPEFKMIIERCCWRQATFAPQQEWTWCRLTPLNCSKTKIIFVDQDYLRKFHIIFCFQYEISVEQLVLTELDSVLKVETQFGHCCEFSSHEF